MFVKHEEKTVKEVKLHKLLVCACKSQDFAQSQKFFARSHDRDFQKLCYKTARDTLEEYYNRARDTLEEYCNTA